MSAWPLLKARVGDEDHRADTQRGTSLLFVADKKVSCPAVQDEVTTALAAAVPNLKIRTTHSGDFHHDRFWIADRTRGVILGTSLNKIGSKIFFIDRPTSSDVTGVLNEIELLLD